MGGAVAGRNRGAHAKEEVRPSLTPVGTGTAGELLAYDLIATRGDEAITNCKYSDRRLGMGRVWTVLEGYAWIASNSTRGCKTLPEEGTHENCGRPGECTPGMLKCTKASATVEHVTSYSGPSGTRSSCSWPCCPASSNLRVAERTQQH